MAWATAGMPMDDTRPHHPFTGLRSQLLIIALVILTIPWGAYRIVMGLEDFLREGEEQAALSLARAVATVLHDRGDVFAPDPPPVSPKPFANALPLPSSPILDGDPGDWDTLLDWARSYSGNPPAQDAALDGGGQGKTPPVTPEDLSFRFLLGHDQEALYALFLVNDDRRIYRPHARAGIDNSDHLRIAFLGADGQRREWAIAPHEPGPFTAIRLVPGLAVPVMADPDERVRGFWKETPRGYQLEIRIEHALIASGETPRFWLYDVDDGRKERREVAVLEGSGFGNVVPLLSRSREIEKILKGVRRGRERVWVVNRAQQVLALSGHLQPMDHHEEEEEPYPFDWLRPLLKWILDEPAPYFRDDLPVWQEQIDSLLQRGQLHWRPSADGRALILTAAHAVYVGEAVAGAVIVEKSAHKVRALRNRFAESLIRVTIIAFGAAALVLFLFSSILVSRVRALRQSAFSAIGPKGRLQETMPPSKAPDELGDLSRGISRMLARLAQYNRYLEGLAGRLSHELRTPLAVVKSSLENMEMGPLPEESRPFMERAKTGVSRLGKILSAMSEASRLEESLGDQEWERFDLGAVIAGCVAGYQGVHPQQPFDCQTGGVPLPMRGSADLVAQMLDKLVSNALDFVTPGTPIRVSLSRTGKRVTLAVINQGPLLPEDMIGHLFDAMVSLRPGKQELHLGMGLQVVQLVAEHHGGRARARNLPDGSGVCFEVELPLA